MSGETDLQNRLRLAVGKIPHARLFRNNRGIFWGGKVVDKTSTTVTLAQPRRVECGLVNGASDLVGLTSITVTPDMVGQKLAVFTVGEVKLSGVAVPEHQQNFIDFVRSFGGYADVVRSPEDALRLVRAK